MQGDVMQDGRAKAYLDELLVEHSLRLKVRGGVAHQRGAGRLRGKQHDAKNATSGRG